MVCHKWPPRRQQYLLLSLPRRSRDQCLPALVSLPKTMLPSTEKLRSLIRLMPTPSPSSQVRAPSHLARDSSHSPTNPSTMWIHSTLPLWNRLEQSKTARLAQTSLCLVAIVSTRASATTPTSRPIRLGSTALRPLRRTSFTRTIGRSTVAPLLA